MSLQSIAAKSVSAQRNKHWLLVASVIAIATVSLLGTIGCTHSDSGAKTDSAPATGQSVSTEAGAVKPTAEQEAAKQRGMAQGEAIHAANEAAQASNK